MIASRAIKIICAAALAALIPSLALAVDPSPQAAIAARQAGYKKMGAAMKVLNEQIKSDMPAAGLIADAARTIAVTAREQGALFPIGSGPEAGVKTDALPIIWTDRETFDARMASLLAESAKLQLVASTPDIAALRAQFKVTGATCASCHRQFRADT